MTEHESNEAADMLLAEIKRVEAKKASRERRNHARREREQILRDLGLVKVRGALGGTYWE